MIFLVLVRSEKKFAKTFGSVKKMKEATLEEIMAIGIPENVAKELVEKLARIIRWVMMQKGTVPTDKGIDTSGQSLLDFVI